jgi:hypothetical protein
LHSFFLPRFDFRTYVKRPGLGYGAVSIYITFDNKSKRVFRTYFIIGSSSSLVLHHQSVMLAKAGIQKNKEEGFPFPRERLGENASSRLVRDGASKSAECCK